MARLKSFALSDIGISRPNNEDVWAALPEAGFFALADGMGGHSAGEVAAKEAISSLCKSILSLKSQDCVERLVELRSSIEKANRRVYKMSRAFPSLLGMGTTLCCLLWNEEAAIYAHVGDSRIYRLRDQKLELLTQDHSLFAQWIATGKLAEECETPYPYKNVITRALGTSKCANPEIAIAPSQPDDLYLLCTDGLSDVLSLKEMETILLSTPDFAAPEKLIQMAKIKGGSDNMTLLIIQNQKANAEDLFRQQCDDPPRS